MERYRTADEWQWICAAARVSAIVLDRIGDLEIKTMIERATSAALQLKAHGIQDTMSMMKPMDGIDTMWQQCYWWYSYSSCLRWRSFY